MERVVERSGRNRLERVGAQSGFKFKGRSGDFTPLQSAPILTASSGLHVGGSRRIEWVSMGASKQPDWIKRPRNTGSCARESSKMEFGKYFENLSGAWSDFAGAAGNLR